MRHQKEDVFCTAASYTVPPPVRSACARTDTRRAGPFCAVNELHHHENALLSKLYAEVFSILISHRRPNGNRGVCVCVCALCALQ